MESTRKLNQHLYNEIKTRKRKSIAMDINKQNSVAVGMDETVEVTINGNAGDFLGALNNKAFIILNGNAGRFVGDTMRDGKIFINSNCREGAGIYMYGGQIIINGNAGDNVGNMSKGGIILIKGNAGNGIGLYLTGGDIIILGNIGEKAGDWMIKGRIFFNKNKKIKSFGNNAQACEINADDREFLQGIFKENNIKLPLEDIKKITPKELRPFYK